MWQVFRLKKNIFFLIFYTLSFLVIIINSVYLVISNVIVDIEKVPKGEHQFKDESPNGKIKLDVYYVKTDIGDAVRVTKTENKITENIFWQTEATNANIEWHNNDMVSINGILLSFSEGETFDSRNMKSIFNDGLMGWDK